MWLSHKLFHKRLQLALAYIELRLINYLPKLALSFLVNRLKGVSSRAIRQQHYPSIQRKLWGSALWSNSYFVRSCGGAPIDIIRQYIENQATPQY